MLFPRQRHVLGGYFVTWTQKASSEGRIEYRRRMFQLFVKEFQAIIKSKINIHCIVEVVRNFNIFFNSPPNDLKLPVIEAYLKFFSYEADRQITVPI